MGNGGTHMSRADRQNIADSLTQFDKSEAEYEPGESPIHDAFNNLANIIGIIANLEWMLDYGHDIWILEEDQEEWIEAHKSERE